MLDISLVPLPEPHPELVAIQPTPSAVDITLAAAVFGWLPDPDDRFRPV